MMRDIKKYSFIDALRGLAILGVILTHSSNFVAPDTTALQSIMSHGRFGVQLFYIASALTLCLSWEARKNNEISPLRNFFIRRFFRIAPMFYLAIFFYALLYGFSPRYWAPNGIEWWFIPLTMFFSHGFHPETINSIVPGGWSIAVEMCFYATLPLLLSYVTSMRTCAFVMVLSILGYVVNRIVLINVLSDFYPADHQYLVYSFAFLNFLASFRSSSSVRLSIFCSGRKTLKNNGQFLAA